jgi:hypothetical protein
VGKKSSRGRSIFPGRIFVERCGVRVFHRPSFFADTRTTITHGQWRWIRARWGEGDRAPRGIGLRTCGPHKTRCLALGSTAHEQYSVERSASALRQFSRSLHSLSHPFSLIHIKNDDVALFWGSVSQTIVHALTTRCSM